MNVTIVHDSEKGNGKALAERLAAEFESLGSATTVGHRTEISPEQVAKNPPDLLVVGAAVRKFMTSPPTKRWISRLAEALDGAQSEIPHAAFFLTHVMPDKMVEKRAQRLKKHLTSAGGIGEVHTEWLSGQVKDIPGPFIDGVLEKAADFASTLCNWSTDESNE